MISDSGLTSYCPRHAASQHDSINSVRVDGAFIDSEFQGCFR